jgi:hypothetical protein
MRLHAFVDESDRAAYLLCVVVVAPGQVRPIRQAMRGLLIGSQQRLHLNDERAARKRTILSAVTSCEVSAMVYVSRRTPIREARSEILRTLTPDLLDVGVERLVLESQVGQDELDRRVLFEALGKAGGAPRGLTYHHEVPRSQPMLWLPDAIAWAYGKGGDWRARVAHVIDRVVDVP